MASASAPGAATPSSETLSDPAGAGNKVQGNLIGTNGGGAGHLGNSQNGIQVIDAPDTVIGGLEIDAANVISSNVRDGIRISGSNATNTLIQGNLIGTDMTGTLDIGNVRQGIFIGEFLVDPTIAAVDNVAIEPNTATVPEPSSFALLVVGGGWIAWSDGTKEVATTMRRPSPYPCGAKVRAVQKQ